MRRPSNVYKQGRKGWRRRRIDGQVHDTRPKTDRNPLWVKRCEPKIPFTPTLEQAVVDESITCLICLCNREVA